MASKLEDQLCCIKHCWSVCEENSIVNSVRVDIGQPNERSLLATVSGGTRTVNAHCFR